jgi:hypothetical protein
MKRASSTLVLLSIVWLFSTQFMLSSCASEDTPPLSIQPLSQFNRTYDTEVNDYIHHSKIEHYLVDGFQDNADQESQIDSFVCENLPSDYADFDTYRIYFYKKSKNTNFEDIAAHPRRWQRDSEANDRIYDYHWMNGRLLSITKWNKGLQTEYRNELRCSAN